MKKTLLTLAQLALSLLTTQSFADTTILSDCAQHPMLVVLEAMPKDVIRTDEVIRAQVYAFQTCSAAGLEAKIISSAQIAELDAMPSNEYFCVVQRPSVIEANNCRLEKLGELLRSSIRK